MPRSVNDYKHPVLDTIQEQIDHAKQFHVRLRYIAIRHDQVLELAELFTAGVTDKKGHEDWDVKQRTIDAITGGTAKWQGLPIMVVGEEGNG